MKKILFVILIFQSITSYVNAQENKQEIELDQVELISSPRIEIKNTDNSISVLTISREEIKKSTSTNVSELLQQVAGLDIRRRGAEGMQADLYIRGCLLYTSPSPRDRQKSRMPSSA